MPLSSEPKNTLRQLTLLPVLYAPFVPLTITISLVVHERIIAPPMILMATIFIEAVLAGIISFIAFRRWHHWIERKT